MPHQEPKPRLTRRGFLSTLLRATVAGAALTLGGAGYAARIEPRWIRVERRGLRLPRLPRAFDGFTLAQISDLHFGRAVDPAYLLAACERTTALRPDAIAVTGDFVSRLDNGEAQRVQEAVGRLRAPYGVYAVLGNHDWWTSPAIVRQAVQAGGATLLTNTSVALSRGSDRLHLAGVDDIWEGRHDLSAALASIPAQAGVILLAHEPDYADTVAADGRVDLMLSGHSHGGQVRMPFRGAPILPQWGRKYPAGWYTIQGLQLYTNRGLGTSEIAVRFNCPPEITLLTLQA
ncbi:MAG: metallophosphoesterase, partial [Anaerolineales bacterium]|nr:metallophosphoesterase [Anaerolineales bacterium]